MSADRLYGKNHYLPEWHEWADSVLPAGAKRPYGIKDPNLRTPAQYCAEVPATETRKFVEYFEHSTHPYIFSYDSNFPKTHQEKVLRIGRVFFAWGHKQLRFGLTHW